MQPHNSNPHKAFDFCCQQTCPLLYNGRIYKCSTAGLLKKTLIDNSPQNISQWSNFIDNGIGIDDNISDFICNFGKANVICGQCPTADDTESIINHIDTVTTK
jgi:hypothetical protein